MFCLFLIEGVPKFGSIDMMRFCWLGKVCSWWSWRFVSCPHPWNPRPLEESTHVKYCIELACNEERWHVYRRWGDGGCVRCRRCFPKLDDAFFGLAQSCTFWLLHRGLDYLWTGCINANHVRLGWFGWSNNIKSVLVMSIKLFVEVEVPWFCWFSASSQPEIMVDVGDATTNLRDPYNHTMGVLKKWTGDGIVIHYYT